MEKVAEVIKLDRGLPLVELQSRDEGFNDLKDKLQNGKTCVPKKMRAEFCAKMSKKKQALTIGDLVEVTLTNNQENAIINRILPRKTELYRNDPVNRNKKQALAANFDRIAICSVASELNFSHIARMLVISKNANVPTDLIITKCDLSKPNLGEVKEFLPAFDNIYKTELNGMSAKCKRLTICEIESNDNLTIEEEHFEIERLFEKSVTTILVGKSGAGKSSLINGIAGEELCLRGEVREFDDKGRHTTVSRKIIELTDNHRVVDMPGLRSLGMIDCVNGIEKAFPEIAKLSHQCKFRDCTHTSEPGCAVIIAVSERLLTSWHELTSENQMNSSEKHRF